MVGHICQVFFWTSTFQYLSILGMNKIYKYTDWPTQEGGNSIHTNIYYLNV